MYQKRQAVTKRLPIPRKGTKYVARALSDHKFAVPVVIAVRDMLGLAQTAKEVKLMLRDNKLKINGDPVRDIRESIKIFNLFEADQTYYLTLSPTGKLAFEPTKNNTRLCKIIGKTTLSGNKIQLNLHDGSNVISNDKVKVNDTLSLSLDGKIKDKISLDKGKKSIVISGKHAGSFGTIDNVEDNHVTISFKNKEGSAIIDASRVIAQ